MKQIKVIVNKGGVVSQVFVSSDITERVSVEVIDFCTDDPDEYNDSEIRYQLVEDGFKNGKLQLVY